MPCALRIALIWLIALAVPIQAFAALTMLGCGPGHHATAVSEAQVGAPACDGHAGPVNAHAERTRGHPADGVVAAASTDAQHADGPSAANGGQGQNPAEAQGSTHHTAKGNCAPCASCCVGIAPPATALCFDPVARVDRFVRSAPSGEGSFLADGLERPPRRFLA